MRVIVIGASGTIGREVTRVLQLDHEVVTASRTRGDLRVDIFDPDSVAAMFDQGGPAQDIRNHYHKRCCFGLLVYPAPSAQIPAGGTTAPGSSASGQTQKYYPHPASRGLLLRSVRTR